jgi:hypothetical protein
MRILEIALISAVICGCGAADETPEDELRRWVARAQAATENKDRGTLLEMMSQNYTDARGNDVDGIDRMLRYFFLRQDRIVLISKIEAIEVSGGTAALVGLTVGMAGSNDNLLGFSAETRHFDLELEHDGDDWLLIAARWGELGREAR